MAGVRLSGRAMRGVEFSICRTSQNKEITPHICFTMCWDCDRQFFVLSIRMSLQRDRPVIVQRLALNIVFSSKERRGLFSRSL